MEPIDPIAGLLWTRVTPHVVFMGVSGSGKTTAARAVQDLLGWDFAEGDDFHPAANVAKMEAGFSLSDEDRIPWLEALATWTREHDEAGRPTLMSCSALRRSYRDILRTGGETRFVHLVGDQGLLLQRMSVREHFMPSSLLDSQLDTLEPLRPDEPGMTVDVEQALAIIAEQVVADLGLS